jgi:hypothetical protein
MITKIDILKKVSDVEIYQRYFGQMYPNGLVIPDYKIIPPHNMNNHPLPSFYLQEKNDVIFWHSENTNEQGDIFHLLQRCYKLDAWLTLTMIDFDFKLKLIKNNSGYDKCLGVVHNESTIYWGGNKTLANQCFDCMVNKIIAPKPAYTDAPLSKANYDYLERYQLRRTVLDKFGIFRIESCDVKTYRSEFKINSTEQEPLFAYRFGKILKVISPRIYGKFQKIAYTGRIGSKYIFGLKELETLECKLDELLLVSNEFEVLILTDMGYDAVCICGRDEMLTAGLLKLLNDVSNRIIFVLFNGTKDEEKAIIIERNFGIKSINL